MPDFPPDDGHWWEYRIGFGWVQRENVAAVAAPDFGPFAQADLGVERTEGAA